jgi:hypothetical protein
VALPFEGALALRRKNPWEAADAGLLLWRENFAYFLPFFAVPFWFCACALRLIPQNMRYLSWTALWLLRPLFDRTVLHVISARLFENGTDMKRLHKDFLKNTVRGLAGDLLWRRFSPCRSVMTPVRVLEHPGRRRIRERKQSLRKGGLGFGAALTVWGLALEVVLLGGEILFAVVMYQLFRNDLLSAIDTSAFNYELILFILYCANFMLVEPLYVCMGFTVYLNSRAAVEGWDLEILFRELSEKRKRKNPVPLIALFCLLLCLPLPAKIYAEDRPGPLAPTGVPHETLEEVLSSPAFGGEKETWGIRLKNPKEKKTAKEPPLPAAALPWVQKMMRIAAYTLRVMIILAVVTAAALLLAYLRKFLPEGVTRKKRKSDMRGPEKTAVESLEALLEKAAACFAKGETRLAWGYCTAAALRAWPLYRNQAFPPDATESDCAALVKSSCMSADANGRTGAAEVPAEAEAFSLLIGHWVNFAYAGRTPPEGSFEAALAFCKSLGAEHA